MSRSNGPRASRGVLSRAARGEGVICPRCRTFAPLGLGGKCVCTSCGGVVVHPSFEKAVLPTLKGGVPLAPVVGNLGRVRTAPPQEAPPPAPDPVVSAPAPVGQPPVEVELGGDPVVPPPPQPTPEVVVETRGSKKDRR